MAHRARLLVTVGRGGVHSVRSKNKSYVGQSKEKECASIRGRSCLPCDSKKESKKERQYLVLYPHGAPERPRLKVFGLGCFYRGKFD